MSLSPLSPSVAHDSIDLRLLSHPPSDADLRHTQHSTPNRMGHIRELPSSEDVVDSAGLQEVAQASGSDIPPDSPIRSMLVISSISFVTR